MILFSLIYNYYYSLVSRYLLCFWFFIIYSIKLLYFSTSFEYVYNQRSESFILFVIGLSLWLFLAKKLLLDLFVFSYYLTSSLNFSTSSSSSSIYTNIMGFPYVPYFNFPFSSPLPPLFNIFLFLLSPTFVCILLIESNPN